MFNFSWVVKLYAFNSILNQNGYKTSHKMIYLSVINWKNLSILIDISILNNQ